MALRRPVSLFSRGMLRAEDQSVVGTLVVLDGAVEHDAVQAAWAELMSRHMRLRCAPVDGRWVESGARADQLVLRAPPLRDWLEVEAWMSALQSHELPTRCGLPLWRLYVARLEDTRTALFLRCHHVLGDGLALGQLWQSLADPADVVVPPAALDGWTVHARLAAWVVLLSWLVLLRWMWLFVVHAFRPQPAPFRVPPSGAKRLAVTRDPLPVAQLDALRQHGTLNDVVLAAVARALASLRGDHRSRLAAAMPVNIRLRPDSQVVLRNLFGSIAFHLPRVSPDEPLPATVHRMARITAPLKRLPEPYIAAIMLSLTALLPLPLALTLLGSLTSRVSLLVSNVRGPPNQLRIWGHPVQLMMGFVPPPTGVPLGIGVLR